MPYRINGVEYFISGDCSVWTWTDRGQRLLPITEAVEIFDRAGLSHIVELFLNFKRYSTERARRKAKQDNVMNHNSNRLSGGTVNDECDNFESNDCAHVHSHPLGSWCPSCRIVYSGEFKRRSGK